MTRLTIGIIGGSISGCMAAVLLARAGHDVTIYERSARGLIGRGGGVTTSRIVLDQLKELGLLDAGFPATPFYELQMSKRTPDAPYVGYCPLTKALDMHCVNWSGLWENMRKRVADTAYLRGKDLISAEQTDDDRVSLRFADGQAASVDLVVFADGYGSLGRQILFPGAGLGYRGYVVWRGVLPDSEVSDLSPLENHPRFSFTTIKGSFVSFVVPGRDGQLTPGRRTINWAAYLPLPEADLPAFMVDNQGRQRHGTIPSGAMRDEQDAALKALMADQLPAYYAAILARSAGNQIQVIYTCDLPAYGKGRMCLVGDAGMVVQPLTGAGVFKGLSNVVGLVAALDQPDLTAALAHWSADQTRIAGRMLRMGTQMEDAFIWNTIDLAATPPAECREWLDRAIDIPAEFSYFAA